MGLNWNYVVRKLATYHTAISAPMETSFNVVASHWGVVLAPNIVQLFLLHSSDEMHSAMVDAKQVVGQYHPFATTMDRYMIDRNGCCVEQMFYPTLILSFTLFVITLMNTAESLT